LAEVTLWDEWKSVLTTSDDDDDAGAVSDARRAGFHVDRIRSRVRYV